MSRPALVLAQPPIEWIPGALSLEVKQLRCEADHSLPSSPEVKNAWSFISTPPYIFMVWYLSTGYIFMAFYLVKHKICLHSIILS
jgi:hypothetical protein